MQVTPKLSIDEIVGFLKEFKASSQNRFFSKIGIFGSFARDEADIYSDIDVVIKVDKDALKKYDVWEYFETISRLKEQIADRFHVNSDVFDIDGNSSFIESIKKDIIYV